MAGSGKTTRQPVSSTSGKGSPDGDGVAVLTILAHPDLQRIGERAELLELGFDHPISLSRVAPDFAPPGAVWDRRPLDDPYLSREPWILELDGDGIRLRRERSTIGLGARGEPVAETFLVPAVDLSHGVVLTLAKRIVLLLHRAPAISSDAGESLGMEGASAGMIRVREAIHRVADLDVPVLLRGESGTGKELVARALHNRSRRSSKTFIVVNLGALSPSLAASELFGHAKGAFTGAVGARDGYFRSAEGGTLFLDEVGEAVSEVQAMLLRALESGEIVPVGSHVPRRVDVRLVAATDSDLEGRARRGDFKEPLLHRLAAYEIQLPPLRQRRDDIGRLFMLVARQILGDLGEIDRLDEPHDPDARPWLPAELMTQLVSYSWPGNVRQLKNVVRQLVIDSRGEGRLRTGARLETLLAVRAESASALSETGASATDPAPEPSSSGPRRPVDVTDAELEAAMRACRFEPAAAARELGISRPSLYNRIRQHPTLRVADDVPEDELEAALAESEGRPGKAAERLGVSARALARRLARRA